jgi:hypothetical protein
MKQILRYYLHNVGVNSAWFDNLTISCCSDVTEEPNDTVILADNQGGKTTTLSLLFSVLQPNKNRFLQSMSTHSNRKFEEYFDRKNFRPGIVILEFDTGDRSGGTAALPGVSQKINSFLIGQIVVIGNDGDEYRCFFSVRCKKGITLNALVNGEKPCEGLAINKLNTLADAKQWLTTMQQKFGGRRDDYFAVCDFERHENQDSWRKHLCNEFGIDPALVDVQVQINTKEAGIKDANNFQYKDEREFLQKFMLFCLNEQESDETIKSLRSGIDQIRDISKFEDALSAIKKIQTKFQPFKEASEKFDQVAKDLIQTQSKALGIKRAIEVKRDALSEDLEREKKKIKINDEELTAVKAKFSHTEALVRGCQDLTLGIEYRLASAKHKEKQDELGIHTRRYSLLRAKIILDQIDVFRVRIGEFEKNLKHERKGLEELETNTMIAGRTYKAAIMLKAKEINKKIDELTGELNLLTDPQTGELHRNKNAIKEADRKIRDAGVNAATHGERLLATEKERKHLVSQKIFTETDTAETALERHNDFQMSVDKEREDLGVRIGAFKGQVLEKGEMATQINVKLTGLGLEEHGFQEKITQEREKATSLRNAARELGLTDTLDIDLDSPLLLSVLEGKQNRANERLAEKHIEKETLGKDKLCIEQFGVQGVDHDVAAVVESARLLLGDKNETLPYSLWLARMYPENPEKARALYLSDPAKYSGVLVNTLGEIKVLRDNPDVQNTLTLSRPVTVSLPVALHLSEHLEATTSDRFVIGPSSDALYNEQAAQSLLRQIDGQMSECDRQLTQIKDQIKKNEDFKRELNDWRVAFGQGKLQAIVTDLSSVLEKKNQQTTKFTEIKSEIEKFGAEQGQLEEKVALLDRTKIEINTHIGLISRYSQDFEAYLEENKTQKAAAEKEIIETEKAKADLEQNSVHLQKTADRLKKDVTAFDYSKQSLLKQFQEVSMATPLADGQEEVPAAVQELNILQALYEQAKGLYDLAKNGKVVEIEGLLEEVRTQEKEKLSSLNKDFSEYSHEEIRAVASPDLAVEATNMEPMIQGLENEVKRLDKAADKKKGERENTHVFWSKQNMRFLPPEDLSEDTATLEESDSRLNSLEEQRKAHETEIKNLNAAGQRISFLCKSLDETFTAFKTAASQLAFAERENIVPIAPDVTPEKVHLDEIVGAITKSLRDVKLAEDDASRAVRTAYRLFVPVLDEEDTKKAASHECAILIQNGVDHFDSFSQNAADVSRILSERITNLEQMIQSKESNIEICAKTMQKLVEDGIRLLRRATSVLIPDSVDRIGGQPILHLNQKQLSPQTPLFDLIKERLRSMARDKDTDFPSSGQKLVAETIWHITSGCGRNLNIKQLKPEPTITGFSHELVGKMSLCGGEALTVGTMMYLLCGRLRAEQHGRQIGNCGALLMDNPFGEANKAWLVNIQRALARALKIQLIYFSGIKDPNTLYEFDYHVNLRPSRKQNLHTGRTRIEAVRIEVNSNAA